MSAGDNPSPQSSVEAWTPAETDLAAARLDSVEARVRAILARSPEDPETLYRLAAIRSARGATEDAIHLIRRALSISAGHADWHSTLGVLLYLSGEKAGAAEEFRRGTVIDEASPSLWNNLGRALADTGKLPEAEAAIRRAIALAPDLADAYDNLACVLEAMGRQAEAN